MRDPTKRITKENHENSLEFAESHLTPRLFRQILGRIERLARRPP
jgi:hypothetical protein